MATAVTPSHDGFGVRVFGAVVCIGRSVLICEFGDAPFYTHFCHLRSCLGEDQARGAGGIFDAVGYCVEYLSVTSGAS